MVGFDTLLEDGGARTHNHLVKSQAPYQLSHIFEIWSPEVSILVLYRLSHGPGGPFSLSCPGQPS